jgi:hypothetical protein
MKQQLLESFGFAAEERFPVYADRFPIQLLSYLRLSRIQDVGLFAKVRRGTRQVAEAGRGRFGLTGCGAANQCKTRSSTGTPAL